MLECTAQKTAQGTLCRLTSRAYEQNKRLVVPLMGFPGCDELGVSIKVAQQNSGLHYRCIDALARKYQPDGMFMMMDLSVEANALGLPVRFPAEESSSVEEHPIQTRQALDALQSINILDDSRVQSYIRTVELMRLGLPESMLKCAYVVGPLTLAGLLEGAQKVAMDSVLDPDWLDELCLFSTKIIKQYANALINAGADSICILEPTGVIMSPDYFSRFSAKYVTEIMDSYKHTGVDTIYHICGNTTHLIEAMIDSGAHALSLDSPDTGLELVNVMQRVPENVVVIGNVNPTAIMKDGSVEQVEQITAELLESMRLYPNFLLSTGCDLPPGTPSENLEAFMRVGREFEQYHT